MAVIQISQIQMRRGFEIDLPGAPTSMSPLTFGTSLKIGEFGYAIDSGRVFIGHNPSMGQPNYNRITFPYQNIEVLTENSGTVLQNIFNSFSKDVQSTGFYSATLAPTATFISIPVNQVSGSPTEYHFVGNTVVASMEYFVYDVANTPIKQGTLRIMSQGASNDALLQDNTLALRQGNLSGSDSYDANEVFADIAFKVTAAGTTQNPYFVLQYTNPYSTAAKLFFNVKRPIP